MGTYAVVTDDIHIKSISSKINKYGHFFKPKIFMKKFFDDAYFLNALPLWGKREIYGERKRGFTPIG